MQLLTRVLLLALMALLASTDAFPLGFFARHPELQTRALRLQPLAFHATVTMDEDHTYFRPADSEVSGFPKNDKPYHRSPCPCMNSLANHGYVPRDGKNLTPAMIKRAIMDVFHMGESISQTLVDNLPATLTLADLGVHNFIEHDASMVHDDLYFGQDPAQVNATLVRELLARATKDGRLTKQVVARWRHDRETQCARTNPQFDFGLKRQAGAYAEAAAFLLAMGDYARESIAVAHAESFLLHERIPDDFERSKTEISGAHALYVAAKIKAMASFPWELLSAYSRWLESVAGQEWDASFPLSVAI